MAKKGQSKKPKTKKKAMKPTKTANALSRVESLLALLYVKGLQPTEAAIRLTAAGLTPKQIASFLGKTPNTVSQLVSRGRRAGQR